MHAERADSPVGRRPHFVRGFVGVAMEHKHIVLNHPRHRICALAFLATVEEVEPQGVAGKERELDIAEAPLQIEAVIVAERILRALDEIRTGAQRHVKLIHGILRHMQLDLGIRITDIVRLEMKTIDEFRGLRVQAVAAERHIEQPYPFL